MIAGEQVKAQLVRVLAEEAMALNEKIAQIDKIIESRFRRHELAEVIGLPLLGAELLAAIGGSLDGFATADRLAALAGVAPAPHDSGRVSGNDHRPQRYHRRL